MTKLKMCGLTREADIELINELAPDYIGFVFFPKSKRFVSKEQAQSLRALMSSSIATQVVGVFVDAELNFIVDLLKHRVIDVVQLHGHEDEAYLSELRSLMQTALLHAPIIKAFSVKDKSDLEPVSASSADYVLLDNGKGGTGESFDWSVLAGFTKPYFLAGGLNEQNLPQALKTLAPYAVDLSSGLETNGLKDPDKMRNVAQIVKSYA